MRGNCAWLAGLKKIGQIPEIAATLRIGPGVSATDALVGNTGMHRPRSHLTAPRPAPRQPDTKTLKWMKASGLVVFNHVPVLR